MNTKRSRLFSIIALVLIVAAVVFAISQYSIAASYRTRLDALYQKSFDELAADVEQLTISVEKLRAASTPQLAAQYASDIRTHAEHAGGMLAQLPSSYPALTALTPYFNEFSRYGRNMLERILRGNMPLEDDLSELDTLAGGLAQLHQQLERLRTSNPQAYKELEREDFFASLPVTPYGPNEPEQALPALLFDGPFSQSAEPKAPRMAKPPVTQAYALTQAQQALPDMPELTFVQEIAGDVPAYWFSGQWSMGRVDVQVAKNGGAVLRILQDVPISDYLPTAADKERCYAAAKSYLDAHGYENMRPNYWQHYSGVAVINFVPEQDAVLLYPDLVKVWVELSSSRIVGLDTWNYYLSHGPRNIPAPRVAAEEAAGKLSGRLQVTSARMALIPTDPAGETLCYEYTAMLDDEEYLVYINAMTGDEEHLLRVIHAPNGQLTQ